MAMASLSKACRPMLRVHRGMALWQTAGPHRRPGTRVHGTAYAGCGMAPGSRMMCPPSGASGCGSCAASLWRSVPWAICEPWAALGDALFGPISASSDGRGSDSNSSSGSSNSNSSSSILRTPPPTSISKAVAESVAERVLDRMISRWQTLKMAEERLSKIISNVFKLLGLVALVVVVCAVVNPNPVRNSFESVVSIDRAQLWGRLSSYGALVAPFLPFVREYGATVHEVKHGAQHMLHTYTPATVSLVEQLSGYAVEPAGDAVEGAAGSTAAASDSPAGNHASLFEIAAGLVIGVIIAVIGVTIALIGGRLLI